MDRRQSSGVGLGERAALCCCSCFRLSRAGPAAQSWMTMGPRILRLGWGCGGASSRPCCWPCDTRRTAICSHGCRQACLSWERDSIRRALLEKGSRLLGHRKVKGQACSQQPGSANDIACILSVATGAWKPSPGSCRAGA